MGEIDCIKYGFSLDLCLNIGFVPLLMWTVSDFVFVWHDLDQVVVTCVYTVHFLYCAVCLDIFVEFCVFLFFLLQI